MKSVLSLCFMLMGISLHAQQLNTQWEQHLKASLQTFEACKNLSASTECLSYAGASIKTVYEVNDFYSETLGRYLLINEICDFLEKNEQWTLLGRGYDQKALKLAQEYANQKKAVVAVMKGDEYGHLALVLPGELGMSGSWNLMVPNSASFFTHQVESSYMNKKLSYAFTPGDQGHVLIYGRKY